MLATRIVTAVIAALLLLAVLFVLPAQLARAVIVLLLLTGAWEWSGFLTPKGGKRILFVALVAVLIVPAYLWPEVLGEVGMIFGIALAWWVSAFVWTFFYPTPIPEPVAWLSGLLVIVPAFVAIDWLYRLSPWALMFLLVIVWAADIGAYFAGKAFGRVKLAAKISPGKTWEGAIGGMLAVTVLISIESVWVDFPLVAVLPLGLAVAVISVVGDLTVSMFKRSAGVKDSGALFPGHGGFLDRADSITAAAPVFALGVIWLKPELVGALPGFGG